MNADKTFFDRLLEIIAVLLLAITTLGTAWCGYQASQWSGIQNDYNRQEAEHLLQANREYGLAVQTFAYDSSIIAMYAQAVQAGNTALAQFYRDTTVRKEFLPILDRWEATIRAGGTPTPLLEDQSYRDAAAANFRTQQEQGGEAATQALQAGETAQSYVLNTIVLAVALFFAGVTSSFRYRPARVMLIVLALGTLAFAASRVADLPLA